MSHKTTTSQLGCINLNTQRYGRSKLTDTREDTAVMARNTALFAVLTASSRVTKSFLSNMSVSISEDRKK